MSNIQKCDTKAITEQIQRFLDFNTLSGYDLKGKACEVDKGVEETSEQIFERQVRGATYEADDKVTVLATMSRRAIEEKNLNVEVVLSNANDSLTVYQVMDDGDKYKMYDTVGLQGQIKGITRFAKKAK